MGGFDEHDGSKLFYVTLPWPPSVNTYWRRNGNRYFVSAKGMQFRREVAFACLHDRGFFSEDARLAVVIEAYPPDRRRRDLDNLYKSLLDSLEHAGVYKDDNQIDQLCIYRKPSLHGKVTVLISEIKTAHQNQESSQS